MFGGGLGSGPWHQGYNPAGHGELHEALRLAAAEIEPAKQGLGAAVRALDATVRRPKWIRWGHGLAVAFALAGVFLLGAFYASVAEKAFHRVFPSRPTSVPAKQGTLVIVPAPAPADSDTTKTRP